MSTVLSNGFVKWLRPNECFINLINHSYMFEILNAKSWNVQKHLFLTMEFQTNQLIHIYRFYKTVFTHDKKKPEITATNETNPVKFYEAYRPQLYVWSFSSAEPQQCCRDIFPPSALLPFTI